MKLMFTIAGAALLSAASLSFAAEPAKFSTEEKALQKAVSDTEMCFHFAGEFNGDGSARDKEINRMQRKNCNKAGQQLLQKAYRANPQDARLYPAVLMLNSLATEFLSKAEVARLCAASKTELVCP
ncbi:hypothetical protein J2W30_000964 [Variovorax boronicumulans]|uniref:hypothetical protein n=1 Tax=Variovorax boronicumulans TaxID=436515 RepID=UPI002783A9B0|nr:hypothetical protein [Variovorax boronicumulans]MDQ0033217.1 hypothetical protein [Variovorax boronicumulans]